MGRTILNKQRIFYGYYLVAASFCLQAAGWGSFNSFGVFYTPIMETFGWNRASVAGAASAAYFIYGVFSILAGRFSDKVGPRQVMTVSGLFLGVGYLLLSQVDTLWGLYLFYCLFLGFGVSGTDVVLLSIIARWFIRLRGRMSGMLKVGTGVGMMIIPFLSDRLIHYFGWRWALACLGFLVLAVFLTLSRILQRDPALRGLLPDGDTMPSRPETKGVEEGIEFVPAMRTAPLWMMCFAYFLVLSCTMTILLHIVPHAIDLGIEPGRAAGLLSSIGLFSIVGRFVMGFSSDKLGTRRALMICFCLLSASLLWLIKSNLFWMLFLFVIVYGFAHGGFFAVMSPLVAEFFGTRAHGSLLGMLIFTSTLGGSLGPVSAGWAFDVYGSYQIVFYTLPILSCFGLLLAFLLPKGCVSTYRPVCSEKAGA